MISYDNMRYAGQVDTHVHHSACMHQKHLLRFIKSKLRKVFPSFGCLCFVQNTSFWNGSAEKRNKTIKIFQIQKEPDEVVIFRDGKYLTLREVFESLSLTGCGSVLFSLNLNIRSP